MAAEIVALGEDASQLAPADEEIVGPLQIRPEPCRGADGPARRHTRGECHQRLCPLPLGAQSGPEHHRTVQTGARRRLPDAAATAATCGLLAGDDRVSLGRARVDRLAGKVHRRRRRIEIVQVERERTAQASRVDRRKHVFRNDGYSHAR